MRGVAIAFPVSQGLEEVLPHILLLKWLPLPVVCFLILAGLQVPEPARAGGFA